MTFDEFLMAIGEQPLVDVLATKDFSIIDSLSVRLIDCLRQYYYVGGMPAAVAEFAVTKNLEEVRNIQKQILFDYRRDFSKHAPTQEVPRINMVWDSIPAQLAKENKKFIFGALKKGARASEFEIAIRWLLDAGLIYQGAFTELFVLTQLITEDLHIYYFSSNVSRVEIDLVVQKGTTVVPIEIKAEENVHAKSLRTFIGKHPGLKGLRLSMMPYQDQEWMENRPLYAVGDWV